MQELLRLVRKARQLGLFDGFERDIPDAARSKRPTRTRRPKQRAPETPGQARLDFQVTPRTLAEVRAVIRRLQAGELPAARKDEATLALRTALKAHPTGAVRAMSEMRRALAALGLPASEAKRIAVTEVRSAVNALLFEYAQRYARERGVTLLKRWRHNDKLVKEPRCNHKGLHGITVPLAEPFTLQGADGAVYKPQYPHDKSLPAGEVINCQCSYDLVRERKPARAAVLKSLLHALTLWCGERQVWKAQDHKYSRREGTPGNYTYFYAEDGNNAKKPTGENGGGDSKYENDKKKPAAHILNEDELKNFIDRALKTKENVRAKIGVISKETRGKVKEICGEDMSHIEVDMYHIRHALNKPAHNLESSDILLSEEAINNAEEIKLADKLNKGSQVLEFKADIDGKIYFVEGVHRKGDGFLSLITCYRQKKARRGSIETQKGLQEHTSKTVPPPAFDTISPKSPKESRGEIKKTRAAVLKSLLQTLTVWKRRAYKLGDVRTNPFTGQQERKMFTGRGRDNWVAVDRVQAKPAVRNDLAFTYAKENFEELFRRRLRQGLLDFSKKDDVADKLDQVSALVDGVKKLPDEKVRLEALGAIAEQLDTEAEKAKEATKENYFTDTKPATAMSAEAIQAFARGNKSEAEILTAEEALASAGVEKASTVAEKLPKTPETLAALASAVEYYYNGAKRELYGRSYGKEGFPDNFTEERRAEIAAAVAAYRKGNPDAIIAWDRREYLVDYSKVGNPPLKDAAGKNIARNMTSDEERVLDFIIAHPRDTRRVFHRIPTVVKHKLFDRFGYGDVPVVKQRDVIAEIAGKLESGEYDRAGKDMAKVADEKVRSFATPEENDEDNENRLRYLRRRWQDVKHFDSYDTVEINGQKGHWKLVEADAPTASHDEYSFTSTAGFPEDDFGKNVNDRNYQKEKDAQQKVIEYGQRYNEKALGFDKPVVVSSDGIVLSGNNRTMSSKRAAKEGTDGEYAAALKKRIEEFGFTKSQLRDFKHPRVVFRPKENFAYTTDVFARFNGKDKKGQNEEELAVKVAKVTGESARKDITRQVENAEGLSALFQDKTRLQKVLDVFADEHAISRTEMNTLVDADGKVSPKGEMFMRGAFTGMALGENAMHKLYWGGMQRIRQQVYDMAGELIRGSALPKDYAIQAELAEAVDIAADLTRKRKTYPNAAAYKEKNPKANKLSLYIAEKLYDGQFDEERMRTLVNALRNEAENDGFIVEQAPKDEVLARYVRKARRRATALRIVKAWTRLWRIYEAKQRRIRKADDHKYIRREGTPGNYTYFYEEDGNNAEKPAKEQEPQERFKTRPPTLQDNIHTILHGTNDEKEKIKGQYFHVAETPQFMKEKPINLKGEYFTAGYGMISRHKGKDTDHALSEENWTELCNKITKPFAIAKHEDNFRLFVDIKVNGHFTVVGVDVKNAGRNLEINAIKTIFGYNEQKHSREDILYRSPKATPEQTALLEGLNSRSLPPVQALPIVSRESAKESRGEIKKTRAAALKAVLHTLTLWREERQVWKADDHKYIRREGGPGNYTYYYTDTDGQDKPAQDKADSHKPPAKSEAAGGKPELPVIEKVSTRTDVTRQNYGEIAKREFLKLDKRIKQGLVCSALQGRKIVGTIKRHLKHKPGQERPLEDRIRRVRLMPFIIPVIEKGALDDTRFKKGQNYYEIAARAETGTKVSVILVEDKETRLLYLSVFDDTRNVNKSLSHLVDQQSQPASDYPSGPRGKDLFHKSTMIIIPESAKRVKRETANF
jgi:hypothetical protein